MGTAVDGKHLAKGPVPAPRGGVAATLGGTPDLSASAATNEAPQIEEFNAEHLAGPELRALLESGAVLDPKEWNAEVLLSAYGPNEIIPPNVTALLDQRFMRPIEKGGFGPLNRLSFVKETVRPAMEQHLGIGATDVIPFTLLLTDSVMGPFGHGALSVHNPEAAADPALAALLGSTHTLFNPLKTEPGEMVKELPLTGYVAGPEYYRQGAVQFGVGKCRMVVGVPLPSMLPDGVSPEKLAEGIAASMNEIQKMHADGKASFFLAPYAIIQLVKRLQGQKFIGNCARISTKPLVENGVMKKSSKSPMRNTMRLKERYGESFAYIICEPIAHANPPGKKKPKPAIAESIVGSLWSKVKRGPTKRVKELAPNNTNSFARVYVPSDVETKERYMLHMEVLKGERSE